MVNADDVITRLSQAIGLAEVLDAAYDAFEHVLELTREHDDPDCELFVPMVLAGASAASGRDYVGIAPALPAMMLACPVRQTGTRVGKATGSATAERITTICRLLALALVTAEGDASTPEDHRACLLAAGCAQEISNLLSGQGARADGPARWESRPDIPSRRHSKTCSMMAVDARSDGISRAVDRQCALVQAAARPADSTR